MRSYKESEINNGLLSGFNGCKYLVYYVDREITGGVLPEKIIDIEKVTEIRAFNEIKEIWIHRDSIGIDFYFREINDNDISEDSYFDETQLFDIDNDFKPIEKDSKTTFVATGGGKYTLPIHSNVNAVVVRNYLRFNKATGRAEVYDFRILDFVTAEMEEVR